MNRQQIKHFQLTILNLQNFTKRGHCVKGWKKSHTLTHITSKFNQCRIFSENITVKPQTGVRHVQSETDSERTSKLLYCALWQPYWWAATCQCITERLWLASMQYLTNWRYKRLSKGQKCSLSYKVSLQMGTAWKNCADFELQCSSSGLSSCCSDWSSLKEIQAYDKSTTIKSNAIYMDRQRN